MILIAAGAAAQRPAGGAALSSDAERATAIEVCVASGADAATRRAGERIVERLQESQTRPVTAAALDDSAPRASVQRWIVGVWSDAVVRRALGASGRVTLDGAVLRCDGAELAGPGDAVALFDGGSGRATAVLAAGSAEALEALAADAPLPDRPGAQCYFSGECRGFAELTAGYARTESVGAVWRFPDGAIAPNVLAEFARAKDRAFERLFELTAPFPVESIELFLYPSLEEKLRATGDARPAHVNRLVRRVHAVLGRPETCVPPWAFTCAALRGAAGASAPTWIEEGIGRFAAEPRAEKTESERIAADLYRLGFAPGVEDCVDPAVRARRSPAVTAVLAQSLVHALSIAIGHAEFLKVASGAAPPPPRGELSKLYQRMFQEGERPPAPASGLDAARALHARGLQFPETVELRGDAVREEDFGSAVAAGADALLLTAQRNPLPARGSRRAALAAEPSGAAPTTRRPLLDSELAAAAAEARAQKMIIFWRSRLVSIDGDQWAAEQFVRTAPEWDDFFDALKEALLHDAIEARRAGAAVWSIGLEWRGFSYEPKAVERIRSWIAPLRALFARGAITYGASWNRVMGKPEPGMEERALPMEFQVVGYWSDLDLMCINASRPTADKKDTPARVLETESSRFLDDVQGAALKADRGFVLTDIGFTATARTSLTPWRAAGEPDAAAGRAAWEAFAHSLQNRQWLRGVFVRAWPDASTRGAKTALERVGGVLGPMIEKVFAQVR